MFSNLLKRLMNIYYGDTTGKGTKLYIGTLEIVLIVVAIIVVFGVGKLGNVGGALGKSIREFRKEKDRVDDDSQLNSKQTKEAESNNKEGENNQLESKS